MEETVMESVAEFAALVIWSFGENHAVNLLALFEYLGEDKLSSYQAIGRLAWEGRISFMTKGNEILVHLCTA